MGIITLSGMDSLHDMVEIQSWLHLFNKKSPILHEEEVCEFYYNVQFMEDGSLLTRVNDIAISLDKEVLSKILRVPTEGTRSVLGKTCSSKFGYFIPLLFFLCSFANALPLLFDCLLALILLSIYVDINGLLHIFFMMPKGGSKL